MFEGKTVLTGVKPTGTPHLGNYFGAIKPMIEFAKNAGKHFMFVAAWEYQGHDKPEVMYKEPLNYEHIKIVKRNYK